MTNHPAVEHCGHQPPSAFDRATECVLRPGHSGSHADETGMRWWERQTAERHTADTITPEALDRLYDRLEDAEADREIAVKNLQNCKGSHLNLQHDYHHALHDVYAMQRLRKVLASWAGPHVIYRNFADDIFRAIGEREPCRGRGNCRWMEADAITDYARAEQAEAERDRYRAAWSSARNRARASDEGTLRHVSDRDFWKRLAQEARAAEEKRTTERDEQQTRAVRGEALLRRYLQLADVTHTYPIQGGHDCLGANLTCAGCALRDDIRVTLARAALDLQEPQPGASTKETPAP